jgi:hypothetical protein
MGRLLQFCQMKRILEIGCKYIYIYKRERETERERESVNVLNITELRHLKIVERVEGMVQVIMHPPTKCETLSSNPSTNKTK